MLALRMCQRHEGGILQCVNLVLTLSHGNVDIGVAVTVTGPLVAMIHAWQTKASYAHA